MYTLIFMALLAKRDMSGPEIAKETERLSGGILATQEGSLYPVMYRLEDQGLISRRVVALGRRLNRIYYHLEPAGKKRFEELLQEYKDVTRGVFQILEGESE